MTSVHHKLGPLRQNRLFRQAKELCENSPFEALDHLHKLIDGGVHTAEVFHLQANLLLQLGCGTIAARATENALKAGGDRLTLLLLLLKCHLTAYNRKPAAVIIKRLLEIDPLTEEAKAEIAHGAQEIHQYELAERLYQELLDRDPENCKYLINLGYACQKRGNMSQATDLYHQAIRIKSNSANALRLLSSVNKQTSNDNCITLAQEMLPTFDENSEEYVTAAYALGKTYEDIGEFDNAFQLFNAGATAMRPKMPYSTKAVIAAFEITKKYFEHPLQQREKQDLIKPKEKLKQSEQPRPLFILGMPRTGSTLIDRILSSHSLVTSMGELGCFKESMKVVTGFGGGDGFHTHFYQQSERVIDFAALGASYINSASPTDFSGRYFTDKYPMNFMDLGLIAEALPHARFIHTIRNPMDTVFGNFKQLFTLGFYHYSYTLQECAEYYVQYQTLMRYWHDRLPGKILDVHYEDLVNDTGPQVRHILGFLNLEWEENCLRFYKNKSPVDTASLSQVRQPIYKSAIGHWQHYTHFLDDAIDVFKTAGIDVYANLPTNSAGGHSQ